MIYTAYILLLVWPNQEIVIVSEERNVKSIQKFSGRGGVWKLATLKEEMGLVSMDCLEIGVKMCT
jgi:hypothetical protein